MRTIKIGYNSFAVPANWTAAQIGEFAAKLAELSRIDDTGAEFPDGKWKSASYYSTVDVALSRMDDTIYANRADATAHLEALIADQQAKEADKAA